jgi:hypothetical protein
MYRPPVDARFLLLSIVIGEAVVGASGWDHRVPFAGSVEASLVAIQEQVLAAGDFIWPFENDDPFYTDDDDDALAKPASLAALALAKENEEFWEEGTHSILDVERVWTSGEESDFGAIRPLGASELIEAFGADKPSAAAFERVYERGGGGVLGHMLGQKWSGRSLVIFDDDVPVEVYFWGWSGD